MKAIYEYGDGGKQAYIDIGEIRVVVRQLVVKDKMEAPTISMRGATENVHYMQNVYNAFGEALEIAKKWSEENR